MGRSLVLTHSRTSVKEFVVILNLPWGVPGGPSGKELTSIVLALHFEPQVSHL